jgi:peptidoglycan-associated lipoprotein
MGPDRSVGEIHGEKKMKTVSLLAALAALTLVACSTPDATTSKTADVEDRTGVPGGPRTITPTGGQTSGVQPTAITPTQIAPAVTATTNSGGRGDPALRDPNSLLSRRNIFFDYDGFVVAPEYRQLIEAHAKYLVANKSARVRIEGNTDERGSREYNLALGQRRADAVRRSLVLLGVSETQIETVSFGEEKPSAQGSSEESWRANRRADLAYPGE